MAKKSKSEVRSKKTLRQRFLALRRAFASKRRIKANRQILKRLTALPIFQRAGWIGTYLSFGSEVSTQKLPKICWKLGKTVAVPVTAKGLRRTFFSELKPLDSLKPGKFNVPEPPVRFWRPLPVRDLDIIIIPGLAFDRKGHRLGYGGGVFDRFLASAPQAIRIGLAFDCQLLSRLPFRRHDQKLDFLITERRILRWRRKR